MTHAADTEPDRVRDYIIVNERSGYGRSTVNIRCPFCGAVITAYVWSLHGSGKRCTCSALFNGRGHAARGPKTPAAE